MGFLEEVTLQVGLRKGGVQGWAPYPGAPQLFHFLGTPPHFPVPTWLLTGPSSGTSGSSWRLTTSSF